MHLTPKAFLKKIGRIYTGLFLCGTLLFLPGCYNDIFKYSIHQIEGDYSGRDFNAVNSARIESMYNDPAADFTFAVVTDSHTSYDRLEDALDIISGNPEVKFVIHLGDLSDTGLLFQYDWTVEILKELPVPFITVIGNHDTLGNGLYIFKDILGPTDFHFLCNGVLFVVGNNNNWESKMGDADEAKKAMAEHQDARYRIIVTHIPILSGSRFNEEFVAEYIKVCETYNVNLSLHGHRHSHEFIKNFAENTSMLICNAIIKDTFYLIHVKSSGITFESISF